MSFMLNRSSVSTSFSFDSYLRLVPFLSLLARQAAKIIEVISFRVIECGGIPDKIIKLRNLVG